ncbi:hypothetical protein DKX38_002616 [Salix brachista]|uniref:Uncharacterized protein n=2 Tax=Salix TaxID=40685 RepID=A0A5N5KFP8_9ROSI|nr:hypothetical protein DKX38_019253 [Salix brachista]KAB5531960.1 hypothetical protein DKX38_018630 [Salix brachista]KAB5568823.1 hypothetical protein DKX38_002616 [Salix brachista]KAJ6681826.1 hypothetical protein OIU74_020148 [Salix koriyanagi]
MKRKHGVEGEGEERDRVADEEEEKIDSFYPLVRNVRDAHDQVLTGCKEKRKGKEVTKPTWTPSFSLEDFAEEDHGSMTHLSKDEDGRRAARGGKATREGEEN